MNLLILLLSLNLHAYNIKNDVEFYKDVFGTDVYKKLTDDRGKGMEVIQGTRNFRVVLPGVLYRSGKINPNGNENPMTEETLMNLCHLGFSGAIYLYTTNYNSVPHIIKCEDTTLYYNQINVLSNPKPTLQIVFDRIKGNIPGPILEHCWNGWHASGFGAATALMQFCNWNPTAAWEYWKRNVDGSTDYPEIKRKILSFKKYPEFEISDAERKLICQ